MPLNKEPLLQVFQYNQQFHDMIRFLDACVDSNYICICVCVCVCVFVEMVDLVNPIRCEKSKWKVDKPK